MDTNKELHTNHANGNNNHMMYSDSDQDMSPLPEKDQHVSTEKHLIQDPNKSQSFLRKYAIELFVFNYSLLQYFQMTAAVYWIGVVRTIEKRFGLSSTQTNFVMSINDIVHICIVIFVGYFGRRGHKPRIIGSTALCLVIGSFLMASPYFIYGAETPAILITNTTTLISDKAVTDYCIVDNNGTDTCQSGKTDEIYAINTKVWYIFLIASIFNGLGGVAMQVLGMSYIDENADKSKSGLYIGISTSAFAMGPITGIFLAAIATSIPENLQTTDKDPTDPTWIGAWWLGYLLCSIVLFIGLLPMFFYPKHIIDPSQRSLKAKKKYNPDESFLDQIKEFPKSLMRLLSNRAYLCGLFAGVFGCYVITGVFINTPRYIEIHFLQPAFKANIGAAIPGIAGVFGGFIGGALMTKLKFTPKQSTKLIVFAVTAAVCGIAVNLFITCPQIHPAGTWSDDHKSLTPDMSCNTNCSCTTTKNSYHPVCGQNDLTYFSPCHAGCKEFDTINGTLFHTDCSCLDTSQVTEGACQGPCDRAFLAFACVFLVMSFLSSLGRVPGTVVQLRIVGDEEGSFALGITSFMINLCAFIPGPILFGLIIDSTCILWQEECGQTGSCLLYDTTRFRLLIFGISLLFEIASMVMAILMLFQVAKMVFNTPETKNLNMEYIIEPGDIDSQKELLQDKITGV